MKNPFADAPVLLRSAQVALWWRLMVLFIVGLLFVEEMDPEGPILCTINSKNYESL